MRSAGWLITTSAQLNLAFGNGRVKHELTRDDVGSDVEGLPFNAVGIENERSPKLQLHELTDLRFDHFHERDVGDPA
jgi:hypothetical protein